MQEKLRSVHMAPRIASATSQAIAQAGLGGPQPLGSQACDRSPLCPAGVAETTAGFLPWLNPVAHPHPHIFLPQRPFSRTAFQSRTWMR